MTRTKNPNPSSTYFDFPRDLTLQTSGFVFIDPLQKNCQAKTRKIRTTKMKNVTNLRRSNRIIWNSASKNTSGTNPNAPIIVEEEENVSVPETVISTNSKKKLSPSKSTSKKPILSSRTNSGKRTIVDEVPKSSRNSKRVKVPEMYYWNKKVIVGVTDYPLEDLEKFGWDVKPYLRYQGWEKFVNLDCLVYRERVREFYSNATYTLEPLAISSKLDGREFTITPFSIGQALDIPTNGVEIFNGKWYETEEVPLQVVKNILLREPAGNIIQPNLKPMVKLLHHISCHCLLPRAGSYEKVSTGDLITIYHLIERSPLSLPFLMIHHMICAIKAAKRQNSLPYGKALTMIFEHHLFDFSNEEGSVEFKPFKPKNLKLMNLEVIKKDEPEKPRKRKLVLESESDSEAFQRENRSKISNDQAEKSEESSEKSEEAEEGSEKSRSKFEKSEETKNNSEKNEEVEDSAEKSGKISKKNLKGKGKESDESENSAQGTNTSIKTDSSEKEASVKSISLGSKAPISKVYTRSKMRSIYSIKDIAASSSLMEKFNNASPEKSGAEINLNKEIEMEFTSLAVVAVDEKMERVESDEEKTEKSDIPKGSEVDADDEYSTENNDGISLTNPSQMESIQDFSSPPTHNSIHTISPDQVPNPLPFSPSLHFSHSFSFPINAIPISTIPPSDPSPDPTPSRVTSHNLESLLAAIDIGTSLTPFKDTSITTPSSLNHFINLNQTPQTDSPKFIPSIFQQPFPSDMPSQFCSLEFVVAAFVNKSDPTLKENVA